MVDILKTIGKFVGPQKIHNLVLSERKTLLGNDVYLVEFSDGEKAEYPVEILEKITSDEVGDWNSLRDKTMIAVMGKIQGVLLECELTIDDILYIGQSRIPNWVVNTMDTIKLRLFKKNPGQETIQQVHALLESLEKINERGKKKN